MQDEDILIHTFGLRLLDAPSGPKARQASLKALVAAEEWLVVEVAAEQSTPKRQQKGKKQQHKQQQKQQPPPQPQQQGAEGQQQQQPQLSPDVAAALLPRLRLRRLFLEALDLLQQCSRAGVEQAAKLYDLAAAELARVRATTSLAPGAQAPGFVPDINRKHMGLAPPRAAKAVSLDEALQHFAGLLDSLAAACWSLLGVQGGWAQLKQTLTQFAALGAHAIVRSALHLQISKPVQQLPSTSPPQGPMGPEGQPPAGGGERQQPAGSGSSSSSKANGSSTSGKQQHKGSAAVPQWCPSQQMVCGEFGLNASDLPGPEAALFIEQCSIAVSMMPLPFYVVVLTRAMAPAAAMPAPVRVQALQFRFSSSHLHSLHVYMPWAAALGVCRPWGAAALPTHPPPRLPAPPACAAPGLVPRGLPQPLPAAATPPAAARGLEAHAGPCHQCRPQRALPELDGAGGVAVAQPRGAGGGGEWGQGAMGQGLTGGQVVGQFGVFRALATWHASVEEAAQHINDLISSLELDRALMTWQTGSQPATTGTRSTAGAGAA